jgi:hypothetical protein
MFANRAAPPRCSSGCPAPGGWLYVLVHVGVGPLSWPGPHLARARTSSVGVPFPLKRREWELSALTSPCRVRSKGWQPGPGLSIAGSWPWWPTSSSARSRRGWLDSPRKRGALAPLFSSDHGGASCGRRTGAAGAAALSTRSRPTACSSPSGAGPALPAFVDWDRAGWRVPRASTRLTRGRHLK